MPASNAGLILAFIPAESIHGHKTDPKNWLYKHQNKWQMVFGINSVK